MRRAPPAGRCRRCQRAEPRALAAPARRPCVPRAAAGAALRRDLRPPPRCRSFRTPAAAPGAPPALLKPPGYHYSPAGRVPVSQRRGRRAAWPGACRNCAALAPRPPHMPGGQRLAPAPAHCGRRGLPSLALARLPPPASGARNTRAPFPHDPQPPCPSPYPGRGRVRHSRGGQAESRPCTPFPQHPPLAPAHPLTHGQGRGCERHSRGGQARRRPCTLSL